MRAQSGPSTAPTTTSSTGTSCSAWRVGTPSAAEDVTSQVFLAMVRSLRRFEWQGRPFLAWLYAIAQKQVAFYRRSAGRAPAQVELELPPR